MRLKRFFDLTISVIVLIVLSPVLLVISALIKICDRGNILFEQERVGLNSKPFIMFKFRTMVTNAASIGDGFYTGENDPRITKIGRFLRRWSLDELPQLINIIKGDMSIVGPRPTLMYQVDNYSERQMIRLRMRPGITGLAQVNGRNNLSWPERIELDIWYVENWNFWLDISIILKTIRVVLRKEGVYAGKDKFVIKNEEKLYNIK